VRKRHRPHAVAPIGGHRGVHPLPNTRDQPFDIDLLTKTRGAHPPRIFTEHGKEAPLFVPIEFPGPGTAVCPERHQNYNRRHDWCFRKGIQRVNPR
jgi:hypothetical protein